MLKIFLSSHGRLASGMKSSLDILMGSSDRVTCYDAYVDSTDLKETLTEYYRHIGPEDHVLLAADMYGGSVCQVMATFLDRPHTKVVAGVNLAFMLEVANRQDMSDQELNAIIAQAGSMLREVTLPEKTAAGSNDDFF